MDKTIRVYTSLHQMKTDEFRDWQTRPASERMQAVTEITFALYAMKEPAPEVRRLERPQDIADVAALRGVAEREPDDGELS